MHTAHTHIGNGNAPGTRCATAHNAKPGYKLNEALYVCDVHVELCCNVTNFAFFGKLTARVPPNESTSSLLRSHIGRRAIIKINSLEIQQI